MLKPLKNRVLVDPVKIETTSPSGLVIPDSAKEKPQEGTVLAIGDEVKIVKVGDRVMYGKFVGFDLKLDGEMRVMINEEDILAIV
jgi:chaperonin GroES